MIKSEEIVITIEDLTSDSKAVTDSMDNSEEELVLSIQEDVYETTDKYDKELAEKFTAAVEEEGKINEEYMKRALRDRVTHLPKDT